MKSYLHFDYVRKIKENAKRNSGGISVFIRSGLCKKLSFQRLYEHFDNTVVLLKLSTICQSEDVIMYFTYISSCYYNDKYDRIGIDVMYQYLEAITADYPHALLHVSGDLNSRCNDYLDFIPHDNLSFIIGNVNYNGSDFDIPLSSKDILRGNNFGKHLVNLCGVFDIHFLNGWFSGDWCGEFTCFSNDGASVVDYKKSEERYPWKALESF